MRKLLLALLLLVTFPALAQKPPINSIAGPTTSAQLGGIISDETGSGSLVFATSPTLVTPILGAATGTSLALNGATLGSNTLALTGSLFQSGAHLVGTATAYQEYIANVLTNATVSVAGAIQARAGVNVHVLTGGATSREVLAYQHTSANGFPGVTFRDDSNIEHAGVAYGNSGVGAPFASTVFTETSNFWNYSTNVAGSGTPPDYAIIQSQYDNGGSNGQSLRNRLRFSGSDYSINFYYSGAASGAGVPSGNTIAATMSSVGKWTLNGSTNTADTHNLILNGAAIRGMKVKGNNNDTFASVHFHSNADTEIGAVGYGNASVATALYQDTLFLATFTAKPIKLIYNGGLIAQISGNNINILPTTSIPAGGTAGSGLVFSSTSNFGAFFGSGAPTLSAAQGSLYLRSNGLPYYNTNGTTGWDQLSGLASANTFTAANTFTNASILMTNLASDAAHTDATVCVDSSNGTLYKGSGAVGICLGTSSARYKRDIIEESDGLAQVSALRPVTYHYIDGYGDNGARRLHGFLAEDMDRVLPSLVDRDREGRPNAIDWAGLVPVMVNAIKQLKAEVDDLRKAR